MSNPGAGVASGPLSYSHSHHSYSHSLGSASAMNRGQALKRSVQAAFDGAYEFVSLHLPAIVGIVSAGG
jgi:hypothetical protein